MIHVDAFLDSDPFWRAYAIAAVVAFAIVVAFAGYVCVADLVDAYRAPRVVRPPRPRVGTAHRARAHMARVRAVRDANERMGGE